MSLLGGGNSLTLGTDINNVNGKNCKVFECQSLKVSVIRTSFMDYTAFHCQQPCISGGW